jgi:Predicted amino acid aldolase or racemase
MGQTPHLRLDVAVMEANIAGAAKVCAEAGVALRPHAKTHKCPQIAERQLAAGATGLTVATIGEAEVFAASGVTDLFIGYPLWVDDEARQRLATLAAAGIRLRVGCDGAEAGTNLVGLDLSVLVELDSGHHRSGVQPTQAGPLAAALAELGLDVIGAFTFPGHSYSPGAGASAAEQEAAALAQARDEFREAGIEPRVLSGGSTPSLAHSGPTADELRPGVYVFGDAQQIELGTIGFDRVALTVIATVVSHAGGRVICDAGSKALGADRAPWATGYGRVLGLAEARIVALSEHHSTIEWPGPLPALGSTIAIVPNHACNAVNLNDYYQLSSGGRWPVAARGRNN